LYGGEAKDAGDGRDKVEAFCKICEGYKFLPKYSEAWVDMRKGRTWAEGGGVA